MPENTRTWAPATGFLLSLTWFFGGLYAAQAAAITNISGAPQALELSATGQDFKPLTLETGHTYTVAGKLIVHYHDLNVRMGDNQELVLLKNGGVKLLTHGANPPANPPNPPARPAAPAKTSNADGISI